MLKITFILSHLYWRFVVILSEVFFLNKKLTLFTVHKKAVNHRHLISGMWRDCVQPADPAPGNWIKDDVFLKEPERKWSIQEETTCTIISSFISRFFSSDQTTYFGIKGLRDWTVCVHASWAILYRFIIFIYFLQHFTHQINHPFASAHSRCTL